MKKRNWAILAAVVALMAAFLAFQNFTIKNEKSPAATSMSKNDFNSLLDDSRNDQDELKANFKRNRISKKGLIKDKQKMKRKVISDSGGSVSVKTNELNRKPAAAKKFDSQKNEERVAEEVESTK